MARNQNRPLSPHLTVWKWGPAMLVSILHRMTGSALAIAGGVLLVGWLVAAASGQAAYDCFIDLVTYDAPPAMPGEPAGPAHGGLTWVWLIVLIGLTWSFFQHLFSGLRHFVLDTGAGYELKTNKMGAIATIVLAVVVTALIWGLLLTGAL